MIEVDPKELIFLYLKNSKETEKIISRNDTKYLPDNINFGLDFTEHFTKYVIHSLINKLSLSIGFDTFYFMENETTVSYDITNKKIWEKINFNFTSNIINIIWYDFLERYPKNENKEYIKISLNEWEAIFLHTQKSPYLLLNYQLSDLDEKCDFLSMAYIFKNFNQSNITKLFPLENHFKNYKNTDYTKRFLLIKKASEYYKFSHQTINLLFDHIVRTQGIETFSQRSVVYYNPSKPTSVFKLFSNQQFGFDLVLEACDYWLNNSNLGYDDYEYINMIIKNSQLRENINLLKNELNNLNSIRINK